MRVINVRSCITILAILALEMSSASSRADEHEKPATPAFVWLEGEKPTSANIDFAPASTGHSEWLSEGKWLFVGIEKQDVARKLPAGGAVFDYAFATPADADYEVWNRVGMEFIRSPFEWRIDDGNWQTIVADQAPTIDLMELATWNEIGWLKMGQQHLAAGGHKLQVRLPAPKDKDGKPERVIYASDCLCISAGPFHPYSKYKPGESDRDATDEKAARQVFDLPTPADENARSSVALKGLWEVCRNDEALPGEVAEPVQDFPAEPRWKAIEVPGDKNVQRPDLLFAHRLWYRTRVNVPEEAIAGGGRPGRAFFLTFPQNNLNTTVYVNGVYCGFNKNPYVHFDIDVTRGIKPGINEIQVGIRDAWYGYSTKAGDPWKLRKKFNIPPDFARMGFQDLAFPVWNALASGILKTPTLTAAGAIYASDVFVKPSVQARQLSVEVTVTNPRRQAAGISSEVVCEVVEPGTGKVVKQLPPQPFTIDPGKSSAVVEMTGDWADPHLWWPDDPHLYTLRTTVTGFKGLNDVCDTTFGFREWGSQGKDFTLNGIPWHGWNVASFPADVSTDPKAWLDWYHKTHQTQMRMYGSTQGGDRPFLGMSPDEALDWCDRNGVPVRRCGSLDGEAIGYMAVEQDPDLRKLYNSPLKIQLLNNWRDQMVAQARAERNHPSVQLWSIENEWLYINCINLYGDKMDGFEAETKKTADAVQAVDPTRLVMTDGGGANKNDSMPVHGNHYVALDNPGGLTAYPNQAYLANPTGGGRGRWVWDQKRPRYIGEDFYFTGNHPDLATIGGESALTGKSSTLHACGLALQMLQQGYRWAGYGAWDFYVGPGDADDSQWLYFSPRAALCREWDWSFGAGQEVKRTIGVFNDTHDASPIEFDWSLTLGGKKTAGETKTLHIVPGTHEELELTLPMPAVEARTEGELSLALSANGHEVFKDIKAVSVLSPQAAASRPDGLKAIVADNLYVCDPGGNVTTFLRSLGLTVHEIPDLKDLPEAAHVLVIGKDAVGLTESTSSRLAAYASAGRVVIVLEQSNPLKYQGLPADMEAEKNEGRIGFGEDPDHPALHGIQSKDLFTWGDDELLYRDAYAKPTRGATSLIQCGDTLKNSALVEAPVGQGLMLLSQLLIEGKLDQNAVARQLLENLVAYGAAYKKVTRPVTASVGGAPLLTGALDAIGLQYAKADDPLAALDHADGIAVVSATPGNLKALADNPKRVETFTAGGGWIVLNGLTPDGLQSCNKFVGFEHMIRPFHQERVTLAPVRRPIMAGITGADVTMYSSKPIFNYTAGNYVVSDEFSYVVDIDDVAPFATSTFGNYDKTVNNFVSADGWPLNINFPINKDGSPFDVPMELPKQQTLTELTWVGNVFYWPQTKINLIFDGDRAHPAVYDVKPNAEPQTLAINPPRQAKQVTLQIAGWQEVPGKGALIGIDNIYLKAQRPPDFFERVKPLLNIGAMVEYPRGKGGILLCNLNFKEAEEVPANAVKKRNILAALLRNLKAPFSGRTVIAGANLQYEAIDLSKQATQFRDEKGWFGDKRFTFRDLPTGHQRFAGVGYDVYDFPTSPVPTVVMPAGSGAPGSLPAEIKSIPVNRKADALFFLQAAKVVRERSPNDIKEGKRYELARYVVHYADGQSQEVPVWAQIDVDNYVQRVPTPVPGAQIAWSKPYEGTDQSAVAYSMQWNNPRPGEEIASLDVLPGKDKAGTIALLAVTAATGK
jgi:hypothetical protein